MACGQQSAANRSNNSLIPPERGKDGEREGRRRERDGRGDGGGGCT